MSVTSYRVRSTTTCTFTTAPGRASIWPRRWTSRRRAVRIRSAHADVDLDGDIDLLVGNYLQQVQLFINHQGNLKNWVRFDIVGESGRYALNAVAKVRTDTIWQMAECVAGNNYMSQNELVLHFGIDDAQIVDEVVVTWPGGATRTLTNVPVNQTHPIYPVNKLGDVNQDSAVNLADVPGFVQLLLTETPAIADLIVVDFTGDFTVNSDDIGPFVDRLFK